MTLWSSKSCCVIGFCHFVIKVIYIFLHAQLLELARLIPFKLPDSSPGAQLWLFVSYFHRFHLLGTKSDKESVKDGNNRNKGCKKRTSGSGPRQRIDLYDLLFRPHINKPSTLALSLILLSSIYLQLTTFNSTSHVVNYDNTAFHSLAIGPLTFVGK